MTKNLDIRLMVGESGLKYTQIAEQMGISAERLYQMMRGDMKETDRKKIKEILGISGNKFHDAADQLENITALDGGIDYGKRSKKQIKALDDAIDLAVAVLRREGKKDGELLD